MLMPMACIISFKLAVILRVARASVIGVLHEDFVMTARAKGASESWIIWRHVLPNSIVPVIAVLGYNFGHCLTSSILVETVFAWPGLGSLFVSSITTRDFPVLQGILILSTALVVLANLLADLAASAADPRVRRNLGTRNV
jgi:peptide/nickel transport system permease protein